MVEAVSRIHTRQSRWSRNHALDQNESFYDIRNNELHHNRPYEDERGVRLKFNAYATRNS